MLAVCWCLHPHKEMPRLHLAELVAESAEVRAEAGAVVRAELDNAYSRSKNIGGG